MNLTPLIAALILVESGGDDLAVNKEEMAFGCLQIRRCVIEDVNRIYGTTYQHQDAFNRKKATIICLLYLRHYVTDKRMGREPTYGDYARTWNGGPQGPWKASTDGYWEKVKAQLEMNKWAI